MAALDDSVALCVRLFGWEDWVANEPPLELTLDKGMPVSFLLSEAIRHFGEEWGVNGLELPDSTELLDLAADVGEVLRDGDVLLASFPADACGAVMAARQLRESEAIKVAEAKDLAAFKGMLAQGIDIKKHDRGGKAKRRVLYSVDEGRTLQWHDPHSARNSAENKNVRLAQAQELRLGSEKDPQSITDRGTKTLRRSMSVNSRTQGGARSLSLIFPSRTLDITMPSSTVFRTVHSGLKSLMREAQGHVALIHFVSKQQLYSLIHPSTFREGSVASEKDTTGQDLLLQDHNEPSCYATVHCEALDEEAGVESIEELHPTPEDLVNEVVNPTKRFSATFQEGTMGIRFKNKGADDALIVTESIGQAETLGVKHGDRIVGYNDETSFTGHHLDFRNIVGSLPRPVDIHFERSTNAFQVLKGDIPVKNRRRPSLTRESVTDSLANLQVQNSSHDVLWVGPNEDVRVSYYSAEYVVPNPLQPGEQSAHLLQHFVKATVHDGHKVVLVASFPASYNTNNPELAQAMRDLVHSFCIVEKCTPEQQGAAAEDQAGSGGGRKGAAAS